MIGYRKRAFAKAHAQLQAICEDLDNLNALDDLQKLLISEIVLTEQKIRTLKAEQKSKQGSGHEKRRKYLEGRIDGYRQAAYVWRCFGDAIAFVYMDKYAIKQTFFNTHNERAKQSSGFLSGKEGLEHELTRLRVALSHKVPALLTDLTNTIRHGDLCLMGGSDPYLLEVKKSRELNSRGRRQLRSLDMLRRFFETDKAEGLRGIPEMRRTALTIEEHTHVDALNDCISKAYASGYAICQPERGIIYTVIKDSNVSIREIWAPLNLRRPVVFSLNVLKSNREWSPYTPFTLLIRDRNALWDFIGGRLYITIMLETEALCEAAAERGYVATVLGDEDFTLEIRNPRKEGVGFISAQMLARIGIECSSLQWMVEHSIASLNRNQIFQSADEIDAKAPRLSD